MKKIINWYSTWGYSLFAVWWLTGCCLLIDNIEWGWAFWLVAVIWSFPAIVLSFLEGNK